MGSIKLRLSGAAMFAAVALAACSPQSAGPQPSESGVVAEREASPLHPVSGLEIIPVTVVAGGTTHRFDAEVASEPEDQAQGLMFRTELGPNEAMLFPYDGTRVASFWMKNTPIPLDIIFIGPDRRIINIAAETVPYSLENVTAEGPTGAVLEIPGGRAEELGIGPGDKVDW